MLTKKEAVLLLEQTEPQDQSTSFQSSPENCKRDGFILPDSSPAVKQRIDDLTTLRTVKGIPVKAMVEVVQTLYPKYDKIIQSKCEHGMEYGIQIRDDAFQALLQKFAPETVKRRAHDRKRNANRIQARLTAAVVRKLKKALTEDGFTVQGWIEKQVYAYLEGRHEKSV